MREVWVDAQLPPRLARWIAARGEVPAFHVFDLGMVTTADSTIFERARATGVVVVTRDRDFLALLDHHGPPPAVVWVNLGNCSNATLLARFEQHWDAVVRLIDSGEPLVELA
jgi:predicted nuclease of predicted toxin-antitoxin system